MYLVSKLKKYKWAITLYSTVCLELLKQSWLFLLTIKQFKGKKRALASGKRTERNAAKKRRCENQSSIPFSLEVEDKGERYHFVLSCYERRCRRWYFFDVLCLTAVTTFSYSSQEEPENLDIDKPDEEDFLHVSTSRPFIGYTPPDVSYRDKLTSLLLSCRNWSH